MKKTFVRNKNVFQQQQRTTTPYAEVIVAAAAAAAAAAMHDPSYICMIHHAYA